MNYHLKIKEEAKSEIVEASHYYSQKVKGLEVRFIEQLEIVINIILNNPKTYKRVYKQFRQAALKKFPYVVIYEFEGDEVLFIVFFRLSKIPGKR
jgi:hypothetical protein